MTSLQRFIRGTTLLLLALTINSTARPAESSPRAGIAVTLNDGVSTSLVRGWPWTLRVSPYPSGGATELPPLPLDTLRVEVASSGKSVNWPWPRAAAPSAVGNASGSAASPEAWLFLTAEQTAQITAGQYQLKVTWNGMPASNETMTVLPAADAASGATPIRRARLMSAVATLQGNPAEALAAIDTALVSEPTSVSLLADRAVLLEQAGRTGEASAAITQALKLHRSQNPGKHEPPRSLLLTEERLFAASLATASNNPITPARTAASSPATSAPMSAAAGTPTPPLAITITTNGGPAPRPTPTSSMAAPSAPSSTGTPAVGTPSSGALVPLSLSEAQILATPRAQWAATATASSHYGPVQYSAQQATGLPNIGLAGNAPEAWCPATKGAGTAWLELAFAAPVNATEVRIRQNNAPGTITTVEAIDPDGTTHAWWTGKDPYVPPRVREIAWFTVRVPKTDYLVQKIRVTFDLAAAADWVEVDAVQLIAAPSS